MPKKICKPRNGRKHAVIKTSAGTVTIHTGGDMFVKWKGKICHCSKVSSYQPESDIMPLPTPLVSKLGDLVSFDHMGDDKPANFQPFDDAANALYFRGDDKSAFIRGFEACQEHKQTISDLQDRLALAENRVENLTRSLKNAKRKTREKAAKLEACREQINALCAPSSLNVCDVKLLGRLLRHEGNTSGFYHNPIALKSLLRKGLISDAGGAGEYVVNPAGKDVFSLFCEATGASDANERAALAEKKYLDEKSRRVSHGKALHEAQISNAELLRKNIDLHLERRKSITPGQLHNLWIIAKTGNVKDVSSALIRELLEARLIKDGYNDNGKQMYDLTAAGKALVERYYNILTYGGICDLKAIRGYDILRREVLQLLGEKAGAKMELEEVRKERDKYRKELLESEARADSLGDNNHEIACELSRARARLAEMVYIIENRSVVRNTGCVVIEMNSACYRIFSDALKGTGLFAPEA